MDDAEIGALTEATADAAFEVERTCLAEAWSKEDIKALVNRTDVIYLTASCSGRVCGIAGMYLVAGEGQITNIAVLDEYRGRHIGKALTSKLVEEGRQKGADVFTLEVASKNTVAIGLYMSLGFKEFGRRRRFYKDDDAVLMELR